MDTFEGKVCVITGAASGIGRGLAVALAAHNAKLVLTDIRQDDLAETARLVGEAGGTCTTHLVDVADRDAVYALASEVEAREGGADLVINNAGVAQVAPVQELSHDDLSWVMDIDYWGVVYGTQAFLPPMLKRGHGHIANVSSVFGLYGVPGQAAYNSAKFAVRGFTEALRHDMAETGVNVSCIHPGGITTNIVRYMRMPQGPDTEAQHRVAIENFEKFTRTSPDKAAQIILRGIRKRNPRIRIGWDAVYMDLVSRFFPVSCLKLMPFTGNLAGPAEEE